jgi:hypothetical protein
MSPRVQQCPAAALVLQHDLVGSSRGDQEDWDDGTEEVEDVASPLLAVQQPASEATLSTPVCGTGARRPHSDAASTGCGQRAAGPRIGDVGDPTYSDMGSPSMLLPSPTTLGSATPGDDDGSAARVLLSGGDFPPSVASTAQGEFDLGEFEDDSVSPMTEDDSDDAVIRRRLSASPPRPLHLSDTPFGDIPSLWSLPPPSNAAAVAFTNFFAASGFGAPSEITVQSQKWEQEHSRVRQLLLQNYTKNLLLGMLEHTEFVDCAVASFFHAQEAALESLYNAKLNVFFQFGYTVCVGIPMVVAMEWHGRLLEKMRRDLFMRAMVRQFLKAAPRASRGSPEGAKTVRIRCAKGIASLNGRHEQYTTTPLPTTCITSSAATRETSDEDDNHFIDGQCDMRPPAGRRKGGGGRRRAAGSRAVSPTSSAASRSGGDDGDEPLFSAL